jgi:di/tricarboxylate transporter
MTQQQISILLILLATIGLFLWGRWRHDMVALASLLACVALGLVPSAEAFAGFGHPAVITVACVLVLSNGLQRTGAVHMLAQRVLPVSAGPLLGIAALTSLGAVLSAFMNNIGAMALLMPIALHMARKNDIAPAMALMPLAFGTILGGMTTLIGTPPNLIVSGFRAQSGTGSFGMFDFSPVGVVVALAGIVFLVLFARFLVPQRERSGAEGFDTGKYLTEVRVEANSKAAGKTLKELEKELEEADAQIVGMVRNDFRVIAPNTYRHLRDGDILVLVAEPESLSGLLSRLGLKLENDPRNKKKGEEGAEEVTADLQENEKKPESAEADSIDVRELVVMPNSALVGRSAEQLRIRNRYSLNLLAISREGIRSIKRLRSTSIEAGDVLLMQGTSDNLATFASEYSCAELASRAISIPDKRNAAMATLVMLAAIGGAALGLLPAAISFAAGMLVFMVLMIVPPRQVYTIIDWPVIVLLAALIPVAGAMASTGMADLMAQWLLGTVVQNNAIMALAVILVITMTFSDFMNNAATAAMMCPIAISTSDQLGVNSDSFLMAVAIGASCAFLTPIGHQNNTLILGPAGLRFGDYWKLGLPLEILVVLVSLPMLLWVWPL